MLTGTLSGTGLDLAQAVGHERLLGRSLNDIRVNLRDEFGLVLPRRLS